MALQKPESPEHAALQQPTSHDAVRDRARGALIGLATGDALGTTNEFRAPGTFNPITDMVGGGKFDLPAGCWTDDTSMALCLAESLIERRLLDPADQLTRYLRWFRDGRLSSVGTCFDIGTTTRAALLRFEESGATVAASERRHAANGSLMRLAPVPMLFWQRDNVADLAARSSTTTHAAPLPVDCCRYLGSLIAGAIRGASRAELLSARYSPVPRQWDDRPLEPEVDDVAGGSFRRKRPPAIRGSGYCVEALEAALWAFHNSGDFATGALLAVNLGDDADTTGAIYGQLAGAFYGESGIPAQWREKLALRDVLDQYAEALWELSVGGEVAP
jgi:ADP-ribosyl-[dinitrogen reductase] hydrolase